MTSVPPATVPLTPADWGLVLGGSLMPVVVVELVKLVQRPRSGAPAPWQVEGSRP